MWNRRTKLVSNEGHSGAHLLDTARVVDSNHIQQAVVAAVPAAQEVAANTAEAVDGYLQLLLGHSHLLGCLWGESRVSIAAWCT